VAVLALSLLATVAAPPPASGQSEATGLPDLATRLAAMTAVTGYEQRVMDSIVALIPALRRIAPATASSSSGAARDAVCWPAR